MLPEKRFLAELVEREGRYYWLNVESFEGVARELAGLFGQKYDLLDVGTWSGGLLRACEGAGGRRSGMDIVRHPEVGHVLRGEFVLGFVEDQELVWGQEHYDVVTMFDVLEHLYQPTKAFANVRRFLRHEGAAVIETGNSDVAADLDGGPASWWYIRLLEHHMVWNERSISAAAERYGFVVKSFDRVRHKAQDGAMVGRAWRLFKAGLCWNGQRVWRSKIALYRLQRDTRGGKEGDHLRVVLRNLTA
jgi:hypothetical protein